MSPTLNTTIQMIHHAFTLPALQGNGGEEESGSSLTNPVIGQWGDNPGTAVTGQLFFEFAMRMWRTGIYVGALIVLVFYVWAGVEWITSGSDTKGVENAKKRFTNATIGLVLMVLSFAIIAYINELLFDGEFDLLQFTLP